MGNKELSQKIKDKARTLGFDAVGIAPVSPMPGDYLQIWLDRQYQGKMAYMDRNSEKRVDPTKVLPKARSIVSLALNYFHPYDLPYDLPDRGVVSRYAAGENYHEVLETRLECLLDYVRQLEPEAEGKIYVDTGPVMDKYWAAHSGIGWLGKHTNVLSRDSGSWFFLGEILLNLELDYDVPGTDFCGSCTRCIDACPTNAIVEPYVLDSRRCISYLTIELREDIPEEFREPVGNLIFGCDVCQDVCPWNQKAPVSSVEEFKPREKNRAPELRELAGLSPEDFRQRYRHSAIKRTKWRGFMRNVAVAMGNSGDPKMIPELKNLLNSGDPMIRRHAAWALKQIEIQNSEARIQNSEARSQKPEARIQNPEFRSECNRK
ncbi:tRNA epoxyqueuosine(34) reductase QueG [Acidobacteria bacterium AH-259-L09]|nr:tRNA epoxyqueuosine(34) reductase QueG [Acidobacteria bacterium AH-259-L09]